MRRRANDEHFLEDAAALRRTKSIEGAGRQSRSIAGGGITAGRLSQAVAASFSTPAPPEAEHRGIAAAAAAAVLQMKGGRERRFISEMERTVVAGVDRLNASHGALSRLLMVPDPLALADLGGACSSGDADGPWQRRRQSDYHYNQTKPMLLLLLRQAASEQVEVLPAPELCKAKVRNLWAEAVV
uniref:Uncharacterized protein n=1 Tax=Oryza nivara TaxID=4536 RepID=A0A0E0FF88_ORYNI